MARIGDGVLKNWLDGSVVKAAEYKQEREILRIAINDNYDKLLLKYDKTEVDNLLDALEVDVEAQILANTNALNTHKDSDDHDERYYPKVNIDGFLSSLKGAGYANETLSGLKADFNSLQTQVNNLDSIYSTDAERIAAINDVINQFQIADENVYNMLLNKANKSEVYRKEEVDSTQLVQDNRLQTLENTSNEYLNRLYAEEQKNVVQDNRLNALDSTVGNSYLKTEVNTLLEGKADKSNTYSKAEIDIFNAGKTVDSEVIQSRLGLDGTNHAALKNRLDKMEGSLIDKDRVTQNLIHGLQVLSSSQNSPVEFEIQGRTLISLGNSNLEGNKYYVLADKKTWLRAEGREGTLIKGVAKFQKSASVLTKADFVNKVSGSEVENPHKGYLYQGTAIGLLAPNGAWSNYGSVSYTNTGTLNGTVLNITNANNGATAQNMYSFNIIEQIERKLGRIPSDTVAGKVQWIKDNVQRLTANWHGWGSSVGGNGATLAYWNVTNTAYGGTTQSHTNGTVTKLALTFTTPAIANMVDNNGMAHYLAYTTNPSDGVTSSQLNTDFVECEIELKTTAVLDTRPIVTRVANFEGKVSGSTVENPHISKHNSASAVVGLNAPNGTWSGETSQSGYDKLIKLDTTNIATYTTNALNTQAQNLFSFDLIQEVERNIGRIPKATTAEKVQWLKDNVQTISTEWSGFGSSVGGSFATFANWHVGNSNWTTFFNTHSSGSVSKLTNTNSATLANYIDTNGFIHYLAYANASDSATASTINTDYVELQISLKQGATLHDPLIPIYEVDSADYSNILVAWDEANVLNRYPKVQGVQHLQNVAVIAEGENLNGDFYGWSSIHANAKIKSPYELELVANGNDFSNVRYAVLPNTTYSIQADLTETLSDRARLGVHKSANQTSGNLVVLRTSANTATFTTDSTTTEIYLNAYATTSGVTVGFKNIILTLGNVAKPFVPRNPSILLAPTKLGQIGDKKDTLFRQDGAWFKRKLVEKDVVLDGSFPWALITDYSGYKRFGADIKATNTVDLATSSQLTVAKYDGKSVKVGMGNSWDTNDLVILQPSTLGGIKITIADSDTGFGETYAPLTTEIQAYFNGWQAKTVDGNGKPTAWKSLGDGTDAPTQTLAYVSANKAPNFTPYKLSYVLATPQLQNLSHLVEGAISVSGQTQVEVTSGVVVREKVTPKLLSGSYYFNHTDPSLNGSTLKNKTQSIFKIFRNSQEDKLWTLASTAGSNGKQHALIPQASYDTNALYEVTYLMLDRHLFTNNATEVKGAYSGSLKDSVDMNTEQLTDLKTQTSINTNLIYRLLVQAKANNWSV